MNSRWLQFRMALSLIALLMIYTIPSWLLYLYTGIGIYHVLVYHGLVFGFLFSQYYGGVKYALKAVHAEELQDDYYQRRTEEIAKDMGVKKPKLMIGYFGVLNAFAVGRKGNGYVVLSELLLESLEPEEVEAVIAHEISHLKTRDTTIMILGESLDYLVFSIKWRVAHSANGILSMIGTFIITVVGLILRGLILIPLRIISRKREFNADKEAAYYTGNPEAVATSLEKIQFMNSNIDEYPIEALEVHELCIFNDGFSLLDRVLGTHPPIEKRVKKMREMNEKMAVN